MEKICKEAVAAYFKVSRNLVVRTKESHCKIWHQFNSTLGRYISLVSPEYKQMCQPLAGNAQFVVTRDECVAINVCSCYKSQHESNLSGSQRPAVELVYILLL